MLQVAPTLEGSGNQLSTSLRSYYDRHRKLDRSSDRLSFDIMKSGSERTSSFKTGCLHGRPVVGVLYHEKNAKNLASYSLTVWLFCGNKTSSCSHFEHLRFFVRSATFTLKYGRLDRVGRRPRYSSTYMCWRSVSTWCIASGRLTCR